MRKKVVKELKKEITPTVTLKQLKRDYLNKNRISPKAKEDNTKPVKFRRKPAMKPAKFLKSFHPVKKAAKI